MAIRNFPSDAAGFTVGSGFTDTGPLNLGTVFALTAAADITGVRFYSPNSQTIDVHLWEGATKVAETTGFSASTGWNTVTFTTPHSGTTGVDFIASALLPTGSIQYTAVNNKFTDGVSPVTVTVGPAYANTLANGKYTVGAGIPANANGANGVWYGVDAVIDDLASPDGNVTAVKAVGTGLAPVPAVSGSGSVTVVAVRAQGTGLAEPPAIDVITTVTGGGPASGTGQAIAPTVSNGIVGGTVVAVRATGIGTARAPGVAVVETLPANTGTGRVTGRFGEAKILVGDVDGIPNLYPIAGETVTFTSTASVLLNSGASPAVVILPKPIVCTLDAQGYLTDEAGHHWCDLIATDDADLTPAGRKWTVSFSSGLGISSFPMNVPIGTTVDLTAVIPT